MMTGAADRVLRAQPRMVRASRTSTTPTGASPKYLRRNRTRRLGLGAACASRPQGVSQRKGILSGARHPRIREEKLLPADLVIRDRLLPFRGDQPVDELLAECRLDVRILLRIQQHDAVWVDRVLVALDQNRKVA